MKTTQVPAHLLAAHPVPGRPQFTEGDWFSFPGGELEGRRPRALCTACRQKLTAAANSRLEAHRQPGPGGPVSRAGQPVLCFQCYRAEFERERRLKAAGELDTASESRFQGSLPYEPINRERLNRLRADRAAAKVAAQSGVGRYADRRRQAQIAARHALQRVVAGLHERHVAKGEADRAVFAAMRAAESQLPESWLPFVSAR